MSGQGSNELGKELLCGVRYSLLLLLLLLLLLALSVLQMALPHDNEKLQERSQTAYLGIVRRRHIEELLSMMQESSQSYKRWVISSRSWSLKWDRWNR